MTAVQPITDARWAEAQADEVAFWSSANRYVLARALDRLYMHVLGIRADTVRDRTVLDIGAGPLPLAVIFDLPVASYTIVDPLPVRSGDSASFPVHRVIAPAETYAGALCDEVWGYNVLQHVIDPAKVIVTAKAHGRLVRWFDWVDTPVARHHPHSISADWLVAQLAGWRILSETRGHVPEHNQSYVALVAERS